MQFSTTIRNAMLQAIRDAANSGTTPVIEVRTGAAPANAAAADSGTLLASCPMNPADAFNAPVSGVMEEATITGDASGDASGTPGHWRLKANSGDTAAVVQGTAGVGSGELSFNATINLGGTVDISNFQITAPGA